MSLLSRHPRTMTRLAILAIAPVVAASAVAVNAAAATSSSERAAAARASVGSYADGNYVVVTRDPGATSYSKTRAATGAKFDAKRAEVTAYRNTLNSKHQKLAASVGAKVTRSYALAMSGFSARLTKDQAVKLAGNKDVLVLQPDEARHLDTWNTPDLLGLTGRGGVWSRVGGPDAAGDGVVVGVIDSGAWAESASFAGAPLTGSPQGEWDLKRRGGVVTMNKADGGVFSGICQRGEQWTASDCNSKLIAARYYPEAFLANVPRADRAPEEYISARDGNGHGSHTASTAVGNNGVPMSVEGVDFGKGSGMAPGAKLAVYKVCFSDTDPDTGDCYTSSSLAAIDDAVNDGVDVLNYSISGAQTTVIDSVEIAFEGAAEAGIFVATSAGNNGPATSSVAHNSPWLTTVANSTHYNFENTVVLGNGMKIKGVSVNRTPVPTSPLVNSTDVAAPGVPVAEATLCGPESLDESEVAGKIVACTRGTYDRVAKSAEVARAGGVGMILVNIVPGTLDADFHSVPTVHVSDVYSAQILGYASQAGATAAIEVGDTTGGDPTPVPQVSEGSSRGPALANNSDLIKPDISAPGTSVLAAVAPPSNSGRDFDLYSGTSMASPHIAGLAALYFGVHPNWSPMAVKSAMMTTAFDNKEADGTKETDAFAQGAGFVNPRRFLNPGLVIDSGAADFRGFITGQGLDTGVPAIDATDFNGPSIAASEVAGQVKTSRTFTALMAGTWKVAAYVPGFRSVHQDTVTFDRAGQKKKVNFTFVRTNAAVDAWAQGHVWLSGPSLVRLPVALRPVSVSAPAEVAGSGASGSVAIPITAGTTGSLDLEAHGLAPAQTTTGALQTGGSKQVVVTVPAGSSFARFDLDVANNSLDFDLYLYLVQGSSATLVAQSATSSADERIDQVAIPAGTYIALIDGFDTAGTTADYRFDAFVVNPASDTGNFTVSPDPVSVVQGQETTVTASWSGLDASKRYLGTVSYEGSQDQTVVTVN